MRLPELYDAQQQIKSEAKRFNVLDIGRRAGKTFLGVHLALETALAGYPVGWFSPTYKYAYEVWDDLQRPLKSAGIDYGSNKTDRVINLPSGGSIEVWSLDKEDAGRSRKYKRVIIDEAAKVAGLKGDWEESIRATLADYQGDAWFLSTPKGINYFHDLFQRGNDALAYPDWRSWQMPSSVNPYLPPGEIEQLRSELTEAAFRQEILAEFLSDEGAVFRNVDACLIAQLTNSSLHKDHILVAGVDWGRQHDFTAISIVCCNCRSEVYLDRFNQIGWDFQRERLLAALDAWTVRDTIVETNSIGRPNLEAMHLVAPEHRYLRGFETTSKSKPPLIQSLALAFEKSEIQWLPDSAAKNELIAYEATITDSGYVKYGAPDGQFDDTVIARALAWKAAKYHLPFAPTEHERIEAALPKSLRVDNAPNVLGWDREGWEIARSYEVAKIRRGQADKNEGHGDPWNPQSPFKNLKDNPWEDW